MPKRCWRCSRNGTIPTGSKHSGSQTPAGNSRPGKVAPRRPAAFGTLPPRAFFADSPELVAPRLLGMTLVHRTKDDLLAGRIVEVEAYLGPHHATPDPAAHTHRGPTPRNAVMFGPAGHCYVYAIYGLHYCVNVSCEAAGHGSAILLRALEPLSGTARMALNRSLPLDAPPRLLTSGPGRLCQALGITRPLHNGLDLLDPASPLQIRDDGGAAADIAITPRIGIRHAADLPLRFALRGHACVSGPARLR
jgi:DNA-3-methyladenine glycosylase